MVHLSDPQHDTGHFTTLSVRAASKPTRTVSRTILFPRNHYTRAPNLAAGFSALDLASTRSAVRANLVGHDISRTAFSLLVETWADGVLHRADATWIEHAAGARECQFGQFDTRDASQDLGANASGGGRVAAEHRKPRKLQYDGGSGGGEKEPPPQEHSLSITFPRAFTTQPMVIVWLNRLDLQSGDEHNYRVNASATQVTKKGFVAHLDTWGDGVMNGAAMAWIAFPAEKKRVASGVVRTTDVRSWGNPRPRNSGWVRFPERLFPPPRRKEENVDDVEETQGEDGSVVVNGVANGEAVVNEKGREKEQKPTVLIALKMLDMAGNADLRIKTYATDVTKEGFRWHLDTWDDSTLYAAEASWVALGFA